TRQARPGAQRSRCRSIASHDMIRNWIEEYWRVYQAHLSTKANSSLAPLRIPGAHGHQGWPPGPRRSSPQGTTRADGIQRGQVHAEQVDRTAITRLDPLSRGEEPVTRIPGLDSPRLLAFLPPSTTPGHDSMTTPPFPFSA